MEKDNLYFDKLVKENKGLLKNISLRFEKNPVDAEDLLQDSLMKAFCKFGTYNPEFKFGSWIGVIIRNSYIDKYRKNKDLIFNGLDSDDAEIFTGLQSGDHDSLMKRIHCEEMLSHAETILEDKLKEPFDLWVEQFKDDEIAEKLNIPIGTVKSRVVTAKKKIAQTFPFYFGKVEKKK